MAASGLGYRKAFAMFTGSLWLRAITIESSLMSGWVETDTYFSLYWL